MASAIVTRRGHAWKTLLSSVSLSPSNAFRIGVASAADCERGEGDDDRDRVRASRLASASDTNPEQHEISGLSCREDLLTA